MYLCTLASEKKRERNGKKNGEEQIKVGISVDFVAYGQKKKKFLVISSF